MDLSRRFVFRANASALGGRMYRPTDLLITSPASSSLTVVGGRADAKAGRVRCKPYLTTGEAVTRVEGSFDNRAQALAWTRGQVEEDSLSVTSTAFCSVSEIVIGKRLAVGGLRAALRSKSPAGTREASIRMLRETAITDVAIDGYPLVVTINRAAFETYDTQSKLRTAANEDGFVKKHGSCFVDEGGTIYATIVASMRWKGLPHPEARIEGHVVVIPDFGRVYFGEILITDVSRRLTMMRLRLGSPEGGSVAVTEVETNGSWFPPTS